MKYQHQNSPYICKGFYTLWLDKIKENIQYASSIPFDLCLLYIVLYIQLCGELNTLRGEINVAHIEFVGKPVLIIFSTHLCWHMFITYSSPS